jgi:transcriptional regulator with XRE-family HTH domain
MVERETFGSRLRWAKRQWEMRHDRQMTQVELGELVRKKLRKDTPPHQTTVSDWFTKGAEPNLQTIRALGEIFGVSPTWLAWGEGPRLPVAWDDLQG